MGHNINCLKPYFKYKYLDLEILYNCTKRAVESCLTGFCTKLSVHGYKK